MRGLCTLGKTLPLRLAAPPCRAVPLRTSRSRAARRHPLPPRPRRTVLRRILITSLLLLGPAAEAAAQRAAAAPAVDTTLYGGMRWRMVGPFRGGRSTAVTGIA